MSIYQSGKNVRVAYKAETTFNTPPSDVTNANQFRATPTSGLNVKRSLINTAEVRSDGMTAMARLGAKSVTGSYAGELSYGTFDPLMEAALRGTWSTGVLKNANPPVNRSFTFEEYEQDIDISTQFTGCRVGSMKVTMSPDGMAMVEFGIVGANGTVLATTASPFYTTPTLTTSGALVAVDAAITLGGVSVVDFTSAEFTFDIGAATQSVIGSVTTPDVFTNNGKLTGSVSCLRKDATRQSDFLNETELALVLALAEPSPGTHSITFTLPRIKFTDFSKNLGQDNALVVTLPFIGAKDETSQTMIEVQTA